MNDLSLIYGQTYDPNRNRRSYRHAQRRKQQRRRRTRRIVLGLLVFIIAAVGISAFALRKPIMDMFGPPEDYVGAGTGSVTVVIPEGESGRQIATILAKADVVKSADAFMAKAGSDSEYDKIQSGTYTMRQQMSAQAAWDFLTNKSNKSVSRVTIPEGKRAAELPAFLAANVKIPSPQGDRTLSQREYEAALRNPGALGLPPEAKGKLEGWLYPSTYEITPQTTAQGLLREMVKQTVTELTDLGVPRTKWQTTLNMASMVQDESGNEADSPKIAQVLFNRINKRMPLQLDSTINYALNRRNVYLYEKDTKITSRYNTYRYLGLPPGPISNPGLIAIRSVLNPEQGPWLYFVATDPSSGNTEFATTEAEFSALKARLEQWYRDHPENVHTPGAAR